jgi:hypothetical protein
MTFKEEHIMKRNQNCKEISEQLRDFHTLMKEYLNLKATYRNFVRIHQGSDKDMAEAFLREIQAFRQVILTYLEEPQPRTSRYPDHNFQKGTESDGQGQGTLCQSDIDRLIEIHSADCFIKSMSTGEPAARAEEYEAPMRSVSRPKGGGIPL